MDALFLKDPLTLAFYLGTGVFLLLIVLFSKDSKRTLFILLLLSLQMSTDIHIVHRQENYAGPGGISISLTFIIAVALFLGLKFGVSEKKDGGIDSFPDTTVPALLIIFAGIVSMLNSSDKLLSISAVFQYGKSFLIYFVIANMIRNKADLKLTVTVLILGLVTQSLYYCIANILAGGFSSGAQEKLLIRLGGTFGSKPAMMAAFFSSLLFIAFGSMILGYTSRVKTVGKIGFITGIPALILTFNRATWVDFTACLVFGLYYSLKRGWIKPKTIVGCLGIIAIMSVPIWPMIGARLGEDAGEALTTRFNLMKVAWNIIKDHPLIGIGVNTYYENYKPYIPEQLRYHVWIRPVHNQYLLVWAEMGIFGLIAFLWFLLGAFRKAVYCFQSNDHLLSPLGLGITLGLLVILLDMNWNIFGSAELNGLTWAIVGVIAGTEKILNNANQEIASH